MTPPFAPSNTINEALHRIPAASTELRRLGLDTCCGGGRSLQEAADDVGMPVSELIRILAATAAAPQPEPCGESCACTTR